MPTSVFENKGDFQHYLYAYLTLFFRKTGGKLAAVLILINIAAIVFSAFRIENRQDEYRQLLLIGLCLALLMPLMRVFHNAKTAYRSRLRKRAKYCVNSEGLAIKTDTIDTLIQWEQFSGFEERDKWVFLFMKEGNTSLIIFKKGISQEMLNDLLSHIR